MLGPAFSEVLPDAPLIEDFSLEMIFGTEYHDLERLAMLPIMVDSRRVPHLQLADLVVTDQQAKDKPPSRSIESVSQKLMVQLKKNMSYPGIKDLGNQLP